VSAESRGHSLVACVYVCVCFGGGGSLCLMGLHMTALSNDSTVKISSGSSSSRDVLGMGSVLPLLDWIVQIGRG
jgi:hypothetical protein